MVSYVVVRMDYRKLKRRRVQEAFDDAEVLEELEVAQEIAEPGCCKVGESRRIGYRHIGRGCDSQRVGQTFSKRFRLAPKGRRGRKRIGRHREKCKFLQPAATKKMFLILISCCCRFQRLLTWRLILKKINQIKLLEIFSFLSSSSSWRMKSLICCTLWRIECLRK